MGSHVATAPDNFEGPGYQDIGFNLTIKNEGSSATQDPAQRVWMVWRGTDGRTDETLASTAATNISVGTHGLTGQDLSLLSSIPANGYASGFITLLVPTSPGAVTIVDPNTNKPVLLINYDKLSSDQLNRMQKGV